MTYGYEDNSEELQYAEIDDCVTFFIELADAGFNIYASPDVKSPLNTSALAQIGNLIEEKLAGF
jgi:hypothetical protein